MSVGEAREIVLLLLFNGFLALIAIAYMVFGSILGSNSEEVVRYYFLDGDEWVEISYASYYYKRLLGEEVKAETGRVSDG